MGVKRFEGTIGRTFADSEAWWPPVERAPEGAPNIVVVLLDDVGYAQFGCYGSDIDTPTFDRLASGGLRYSNFHTTALCSPTRACLMTGRNHHSNGMARIVEMSSGFPGYDATIPPEHGFLPEILLGEGYATFAVGKWHLAPAHEMTHGSSRARWPLGKGFERFYGFLGGETDQFHPDLVHDNHQVDPPATPEEGYHLTEDLADRAIGFLTDLRNADPDRPFFLYVAPGACHAPHQAPAAYIDAYRGRFDQGWDAWRDEVFQRQVASGLLPAGTEISPRPPWVPAWDSLTADERRLFTRMMEVYAGFLTHTDAQVGRILDFVERLGELDDTIVLVMSDNGASAEGGPHGSVNEQYFFNGVPETVEENLAHIDDLGTPRSNNHYPWGWAWAGNCPFKRFKRDTHEGGVADPLVVHWPRRLAERGGVRHQYVHVIDVLPTLLDLIGIAVPSSVKGVPQAPIEGVSFAPSIDDAATPSGRVTQYFEMMGSRGIYHDGWKAVTNHPPFLATYDGADPMRSFDDDRWELYHVAEDFAEVHDLAETEPGRLAELQDRWWAEAERYQVLPLNNQPGRFGDRRFVRQRYVLYPGGAAVPEAMAPNLRNRAFTITARLSVPEGDAVSGVILGHGGHSGGYALALRDGRLHYVNNFVGNAITVVAADRPLPSGPVVVRADFTPTGRFQGEVELRYGDEVVARGPIPSTTPITYGVFPFSVGYQRTTPIWPDLPGRAEVPAGVVDHVVVEAAGRSWRDPAAEAAAALAQQ